MDGWLHLANRGADLAHLWVINEIVHSWVDPVFGVACIAGLFAALGYGGWRLIKYLDD